MRRFLAIWAIATLVFAAVVLALNLIVDPYGIIGTPRIPGLTADKVAAIDRPRMTKPYLVEKQYFATIVLGASNTDVGIDPASDAWPTADRPVFNLAIDGGNVVDQYHFLQHALVTHPHPKLIIAGVTFEDAMTEPPATDPATADRPDPTLAALFDYEDRLRVKPDGQPNPAYALTRLKDTVFATFSLQALTDSVITLLRQDDPGRAKQTEQGLNTGGNFARWIRNEGSYSLVHDKDLEHTPKLIAWGRHARTIIAPLADTIRLAHAHGARIIVFIMPGYVDQLEVLRQTGLMPEFRRWKMDLARIVEQADPTAPPTPLWDFSGVSPYTTELLPGPGDTAHPLQYFWEPVHFRTALGDLMIRRMLDNGGPPDLGELVTTASLPDRFPREDALLQQWAAAHPADVARLATIVDAAAHTVCGGPIAQCPRPNLPTTASK